MWWGKVLGIFFGLLLAGPIGAAIGLIIGHFFDRGLTLNQRWEGWQNFTSSNSSHAREAFFVATFSVMGHVAKADGRVSEDEIRLARQIMQYLGLDDLQKKKAIELFNQGKQVNFNLASALKALYQGCRHDRVLLQMFMGIQLQAAYADGQINTTQKKLLQDICNRLGFAALDFEQFERTFRAEQTYQETSSSYRSSPQSRLSQAYILLGLKETATDSELKRAYRKLMSQHHPDKLISKGLPESMLKLATQKTQEIQAAYEEICKFRLYTRQNSVH